MAENPAVIIIAQDQHDSEVMRLHRKTLSDFKQLTVSAPGPISAPVLSLMTGSPPLSKPTECTPAILQM